ncbi:transposable element Tcb1 transposase [Trichonephila clavipes]|nr:transposable element Tcb1 transposase [Trichonephila clavipes]
MPSTSSSVSTVSMSSSSTQAHLLPSPSAIIPTIQKSVPTISNSEHSNAPEIPQCVKRNSRNRKKRPKVQKPEIEIKMAKHKNPKKSGPIEYTTDDEDMIMYDVVAEELEPNPEDKFAMKECFINNPNEYMRALTPTRFRKSRNRLALELRPTHVGGLDITTHKTARGGRVRSTTPAEDRYIVLSAKTNRRTTAQQVANQFLAASGKQISRKTVARHESRFSLSSDCRRQLIWRESGTAYRPENIQEKDRYPTCSIMVWAGIMINGRKRLHVVANGTMTGQRYIDEVLLPHVRLFRGAVGDKFVFMDDNATCHRTLAVQVCLDSEGIQRLVWPARSPDLNPIENVWDALGRQVAGRNYPPINKNTLIRELTEEWDKLPQQLLDNVVQSMRLRGSDASTLRITYITLVRPVLEYGYQIFQVASPTNLKKLERECNSVLRGLSRALDSCPTDIVLYEADIQPLTMRFEVNSYSCISPIDSFNHVEFRVELLTSTPKHSSHPDLLRLLALGSLVRGNKYVSSGIPPHVGVPGNEAADELAGRGCDLP